MLVHLVVDIEAGHHLDHVAGLLLVGRWVIEVERERRALGVEAACSGVEVVGLSIQEVVIVRM